MNRIALLLTAVAILTLAGVSARAGEVFDPPFMSRPNLSPDGAQIAFEYGGDIWICSSEGGEARRLTVHVAGESRPYFSPDGRHIVYSASYYGFLNMFIMPVEGGEARRLTFGPGYDIPSAWGEDGWIYFYSSREGFASAYKVRASGGTPVKIAGALRDDVYSPVPSFDGKSVAFCYRSSLSERNRQGTESYYTAEIYVADNTAPATSIKRVTNNMNQDFVPQWSPDGKYLYFMTDADKTYNVMRWSVGGGFSRTKKITKLNRSGVRWLTISKSGKAVVLKDRAFHVLDLDGGGMRQISVSLYDPPKMTVTESTSVRTNIDEFIVSPDSKKVAFVSNHDLFVMASEGGFAKQLTDTPAREYNISWAPDSTHILFNRISEQGLNIFRIDARDRSIEQVTRGPQNRFTPYYTPDGKSILYNRGYDAICSCDPDGSNEKVLASDVFAISLLSDSRRFEVTPDGKWLMYTPNNELMAYDILLKKMGDDSEPISVAPLGGYSFPLGFTSDYRKFLINIWLGGMTKAYVLDLEDTSEPAKGRRQKLEDVLNPPPPPAKGEEKPAEEPKADEDKPKPGDSVDTTDLLDKIRPLIGGTNVPHYAFHILPNNKAVLVAVQVNGVWNAFIVPMDPTPGATPRPVTNTGGQKGGFEVDKAGKFLYYTEDGALFRVALGGGNPQKLSPVSVRSNRTVVESRLAVLEEAVWVMRWGFYDEGLHGVDPEALEQRYANLVRACKSDENMHTLMWEFIGEFDASHMSFQYKPLETNAGQATEATPHLGFEYDHALMEQGVLKVARLIPGTPAAAKSSGLKEGDFIKAINGVKIEQGTNIYEILRVADDSEIEYAIADSADGGVVRKAWVAATPFRDFVMARIAAWEDTNRKYVEKKTNGRFGYILLDGMMDEDWAKFELYMQRYLANSDGVVLDFRYNAGGFIAFRIADVLDNKPWMFSKFRGGTWVPENMMRSFGYQKATVALFNYASYSNAEMMAAAYRLLDLGPSVGLPTAGGVIGVTTVELVDGSQMGLPRLMVVDGTGRNMERSPTAPSHMVDRDIIDEMAGRDPQLDKAIEELEKEAKRNGERLAPRLK